jgi:predicted protein tyrosine phosphatase
MQVVSLVEATAIRTEFDAIISAGVRPSWSHPCHIVRQFHDGIGGRGCATVEAVAALLAFGASRGGSMLVHCQQGESRSTAIAVGLMVQAGATPTEAVTMLRQAHPAERRFAPNALVMMHVEAVLGSAGLVADVAKLVPTAGVLLPMATTRRW